MCLEIDYSKKSLNKRIVWKVFGRQGGKIVSLFQAAIYPKGKLVNRNVGIPDDGYGYSGHGLHFFTSKAFAKALANAWSHTYIAKFAVDPVDFMFASKDGKKAIYERATRIGNFIKMTE